MVTRKIWRAFAWVGTLLVVTLCLVPAPDVPAADVPQFDKLLHVVAFLGIGLAWRLSGLAFGQVVLLGVGLILVTEIGQSVLPTGRHADGWDALADAGGLALGLLLAARVASWAVRPAD